MTAGAIETRPSRACPTLHNRTEPCDHRRVVGTSTLTVWSDGQTVRVTRPGAWAAPQDRQCTSTTASGGRCRRVALVGGVLCAAHAGVIRTEVTEFTPGSRRRLLLMLGRIRRDRDALLVTLTWPAWAAPDRDGWHRSWDRLRVGLVRRFPHAGGVWRREFTRAGTVHLHLLLYGVTYPQLRRWLPAAWADAVDAPDRELRERVGTNIEVPRHWRAVACYVAKYVGKRDRDQNAPIPLGRWYGVFGRQNIPWSLSTEVDLPDAVAVRLIRTGHKWVDAQRRKRSGYHPKPPGRMRVPRPRLGLSLLTADPSAWARLAAMYVTDHQENVRAWAARE